jgi:hypothetical protein
MKSMFWLRLQQCAGVGSISEFRHADIDLQGVELGGLLCTSRMMEDDHAVANRGSIQKVPRSGG